jgi:tight adherence protein C
MLIFLIAVAAFGLAYLVLDGLTIRQKQTAISLDRARHYGTRGLRESELARTLGTRVLSPALKRLTAIGTRLPGGADPAALRRKLNAAGLEAKLTVQNWLALKAGLIFAFLGLGVFLIVTGALPKGLCLMIGGGGAVLMLIAPDYWLTLRARKRLDDIVVALPDMLDLLTVSVEAGLGFDAAVAKITEKGEGALLEELKVTMHETRMGETRTAALKHMAERLDLQPVTAFTRSIIQAEQLGISLARVLRVQAVDQRNKRQMAAEEKAMKAPIKMLFPTVIFIFPTMFIVVLGPAMMNIMKAFSGANG